MKRIATLIAIGTLLTAFALAQPGKPRYTVIDLGPVGNSPGAAYDIAANGLVAGAAATPDGTAIHAVLSYRGQIIDLGKTGVGRPNSVAYGVNDRGQVVGAADTTSTNGADDFCGFNADGFTSKTACVPFVWQNGLMTPLPTPGANGVAWKINNRGQAVGFSETGDSDPGCPVGRFKPVVWEFGGIRQLSVTIPGSSDSYGIASAINDNGQVVGSSGACGAFNPYAQNYLVLNHALLWDRDGTPHDLGNLGGAGGFGGNHACAVNNRGQVAGHSELPHSTAFHAFLWTEADGMVDLKTLPGDSLSLANGINDAGEVVGASIAADLSAFTAVRWGRDGITDLNTLVDRNPAGLYLLVADWVNASGEIVGLGYVARDGFHAFLATPNRGEDLASDFLSASRPLLTGRDRDVVIRRLGLRLP